MNVIMAKDYDELNEKAVRIIIDTVRKKPLRSIYNGFRRA